MILDVFLVILGSGGSKKHDFGVPGGPGGVPGDAGLGPGAWEVPGEALGGAWEVPGEPWKLPGTRQGALYI